MAILNADVEINPLYLMFIVNIDVKDCPSLIRHYKAHACS